MILSDLPARASRCFGDKAAVIAGGNALSFAQIDRLSACLAGALAARGIGRGDVVTLHGENGWEWVVAYYAIARAGAAINPVNALLTPEEVRYIADDCGVVAVIGSAARLGVLAPALEGSGVRLILSFDAIDDLVAEGHPAPDIAVAEGDLATIAYTSGTTGRPKGALLSHRNIVTNTRMTALMHGRSASDVIVTALPLPHVYGNVVMNAAMLCGSTLAIHPRFDAAAMLDAIAAHRATMFEGVPTMYHYLLQSPALEGADLSSLRLCTVGGQTMPVSAMAAIEARFGCPLIELWGMTELGGLGTTHPHTGPYRHGSIGVPLPFMEARIDAPEDGVGELLVRGAMVMQGYHKAPQATAEAIDAEGWLRTGDLARADGDGFLAIVDRRKDMILTAGNNIYPAELERVIALHPGVAMAAVAGLPDAAKGEVPVAFVVAKAGVALGAAEMEAHCRAHLAAYKVPRAFLFVDDLPRTSTGKVMRRALATLAGEQATSMGMRG